MADEKKPPPAAATHPTQAVHQAPATTHPTAPAARPYRVVHGAIVHGTDALGARSLTSVGETVSLSAAEAKPMLEAGVIEAT